MGDRIRKAICGPGYCFASLVCAKTGKKYATPFATSRLQRCFGSHAGIPNTKVGGSSLPTSPSSFSSSTAVSPLADAPTTFGDHRRLYPLPYKRCSPASLPLNVQHSDRFLVSRRGQALYMQTFRPPHLKEEGVKGVVFLVHDYGDHSSWFLRDLAVALCQQVK